MPLLFSTLKKIGMDSVCRKLTQPIEMEYARILLQTSNKKLGNSLYSILKEAGYTVLSIKNRRGIINLAANFKPELLIIEGNVAENDSAEIVYNLKEALHVKVLATSCDDNKEYLLSKGFDDCLNLPYQPTDIQKTIQHLLAA